MDLKKEWIRLIKKIINFDHQVGKLQKVKKIYLALIIENENRAILKELHFKQFNFLVFGLPQKYTWQNATQLMDCLMYFLYVALKIPTEVTITGSVSNAHRLHSHNKA